MENLTVQEAKELAIKEEMQNGFYIHNLVSDEGQFINCHTHGLLRNFGFIELEVRNPKLSIEINRNILESTVGDIKYQSIPIPKNNSFIRINKKLCMFKLLKDDFEMLIYRIIFPDDNGLYPWEDGCDPIYKTQFTESDMEINRQLLNY